MKLHRTLTEHGEGTQSVLSTGASIQIERQRPLPQPLSRGDTAYHDTGFVWTGVRDPVYDAIVQF